MCNYRIMVVVLAFALLTPACSNAKTKARTVQEPVVAGVFYPDNPLMLKMTIANDLKKPVEKQFSGHLMGVIVPHAGYRFSGPVAAYAFKQVVGKPYTTVVVMAPSHRMPLRGAALSTRDAYRTPLGDIPIDTKAVAKLITENAWAEDDQRPFMMEHALEVELPFLQTALKNFKLVPIIIGTHDKATLDAMATSLNKMFPGDDVLFVASTDLSHYQPYDEAVRLDRQTLKYVTEGDPDAYWAAEEDGRVLACGAAPTYIAMKLWKLRGGGEIEVLQYLNSGDTSGDKSKVVGYAAVALITGSGIRDQGSETGDQALGDKVGFSLTDIQRKTLLTLAKKTVTAKVSGKNLPSIATDDPLLKENGASFVTLKKNGELRGCIGHIIAREPLIENVRNMAVSAASSDPRFPPVRPDELKDIHVEVSVLTPPQPLENPLEVAVGTDGLIIERGFNRGVLLPQVPTEQGWNKDQYLKGICQKAGMEPTCWKTAKLEKFQAIVFGE